MAAACQSIPELRQKMAERFGRQQVQFTLWIDPPARQQPKAITHRASDNSKGQFEPAETLSLLGQEAA